jgi:hypothetical protein
MNAADVISPTESIVSTQQQKTSAAEGFQDALDAATREEENLPVEAYSLPDWYADLTPKQCILNPCINHAYWNQVEAFGADGTISHEEQAVLASMRENDTARQTELENEAWRWEHREELSEYFGLLNGYLREALDENGIEGAAAYYENVVLNPAGSEQVRQSFMDRLNANPRALELMESLGVSA